MPVPSGAQAVWHAKCCNAMQTDAERCASITFIIVKRAEAHPALLVSRRVQHIIAALQCAWRPRACWQHYAGACIGFRHTSWLQLASLLSPRSRHRPRIRSTPDTRCAPARVATCVLGSRAFRGRHDLCVVTCACSDHVGTANEENEKVKIKM